MFGRKLEPVGWSSDLERVFALPRRAPPDAETLRGLSIGMTERLRRAPDPGHVCDRDCIRTLLQIQAWGLWEAPQAGGVFGPIGVGHGKTGLDILLPMVMSSPDPSRPLIAMLLIPPGLREQFSRDYARWSRHFQVPNLAGGRFFVPGRPLLHVVAYSELSSASAATLMDKIRPDLVIADEAHSLASPTAARTKRFLRWFLAKPRTMFCGWSGTLMNKSIRDCSHLAALALKEGSPLPTYLGTVEEWAMAVDPIDPRAPAGELQRLSPGEDVRHGLRRRMRETLGVVATEESALGASLVISERVISEVPPAVLEAISTVRKGWVRPDQQEEFTDILQVTKCARELSSGFYYRWRWPQGQDMQVVREWLDARADWHCELREKLKRSEPYLDSALLCARAAIRWHRGYKWHEREFPRGTRWCGHDHAESPFCDASGRGPLRTWDSDTWLPWERLRDACDPRTEAVWVDEFLAQDAARWARENVGIVWYLHDAFGKRVAQLAETPLYGAGKEAEIGIAQEDGSRSIVACIQSHSVGRHLERFSRNLVANSPVSAKTWEQTLGRTHRPGQESDEVEVHVYRHTKDSRDAFDEAISNAEFVQETEGSKQKLLMAAITWRR